MKEIHIHNSENPGTILKYCSWIPAIMIMTMIFQFSAANGVESSGTSSGLLECIFNKSEEILSIEIPQQKREQLIEVLETPLRKCAHITEYLFLALFVVFPCYVFGNRGKALVCRSAVISVVYACTDELHQYFVPGRAGRIVDVCIDSIGIWGGIGVGLLLIKLITKSHKFSE